MKPGSAFLVWLLLLALLLVELGSAYLTPTRALTPFIGILMASIIAITFMRLGSSRGLPPMFAIAGVFWLIVMLGLGSLDSFTRHDIMTDKQNEVATVK